jgi:hypothetical protein
MGEGHQRGQHQGRGGEVTKVGPGGSINGSWLPPPCRREALHRPAVESLGRTVIPEIAELDFNPIMAYPDGCVAVDARIIVGPSA